jgi:hypothetical protein
MYCSSPNWIDLEDVCKINVLQKMARKRILDQERIPKTVPGHHAHNFSLGITTLAYLSKYVLKQYVVVSKMLKRVLKTHL